VLHNCNDNKLFRILNHFHVGQLQLGCLVVNLLVGIVIDDGDVADINIVDAVDTLKTRSLDARMSTTTGDTADMNVLELGC